MIIDNPKSVNGVKLTKELTVAGIANTGVSPMAKRLVINVSETDESAAMAVYDAHDPTPDIVYNIEPQSPNVRVGKSLSITAQGAPNETVTLYAYPFLQSPTVDDELDPVTLDADGRGSVSFAPLSAGEYAIRGKDGALADIVSIVKVVA
jgi:hypothetical protein